MDELARRIISVHDEGARRAELEQACREYGEACGATLRFVYLGSVDDFMVANRAKSEALERVKQAWRAMVEHRDPATLH